MTRRGSGACGGTLSAEWRQMQMPPAVSLRIVKTAHTLVWAVFAGCILAIPPLAAAGRFTAALTLILVVLAEVVVLAVNGWRCPLTGVAARYTDDRRENFDIYLPLWLARHNKRIFGALYAGGLVFTLARWLGRMG
jgi:polyferredoxin